jgi:hypothetical protein
MLSYPSTISLSTQTLQYVTRLVKAERDRIGSPWRRLPASQQALLVLAHLRNGDTYARLAAGFGIGIATVFRYIRETTTLLAAQAPTLTSALWQLAWSHNNYAILDGTVIRIDRIAANKPYYSGKHKHHGINLQALTDPYGRLLWISDGLPGAVNDTAAARHHHIPDLAAQADILLLADAGYHHIADNVATPYKGRKHLTQPYLDANKTHATLRCRGERGFATLKNWHILDRVRASTHTVPTLAKAILTLEHTG